MKIVQNKAKKYNKSPGLLQGIYVMNIVGNAD